MTRRNVIREDNERERDIAYRPARPSGGPFPLRREPPTGDQLSRVFEDPSCALAREVLDILTPRKDGKNR